MRILLSVYDWKFGVDVFCWFGVILFVLLVLVSCLCVLVVLLLSFLVVLSSW